MLVEKSNSVYADLSSFNGLTNLLTKGTDGIRPLMAESEDGEDFITYGIRFLGKRTKDRATEFQVMVWCWSDNYNQSLAMADAVESAFGASSNFYTYESAQPKYNEQNEIYTEIIFNIKN